MALVARYEDTRDLRLMGGYRPGRDAELDQAVALVPRIYEAMDAVAAVGAEPGRVPRTRAGAASEVTRRASHAGVRAPNSAERGSLASGLD